MSKQPPSVRCHREFSNLFISPFKVVTWCPPAERGVEELSPGLAVVGYRIIFLPFMLIFSSSL